MGTFREVTTEGGGGHNYLRNVLPRSGSSSVTIWGRDLIDDGINGSKTRGRTCEISAAGDRSEDATDRGRFLAEGGRGKRASGGGDKTSQDLH